MGVEVDTTAGGGRVHALHDGQQALDGGQVLARGLVVHDVRRVHNVGDLLTRAALVDAHTGHPNGPGIVACDRPSVSGIAAGLIADPA